MPASSAETRNRWRKRKRGRKPKPKPQEEDDLEDEEDEDDEEFDEDQQYQNPNHSTNRAAPISPEIEVLSDGGVKISDFPVVIRHTVNRPHSSVMAIVDTERASQCGESRGQIGVVLENISYGQLQALSSVSADCPALGFGDQDGASSAFVITPPAIMESRGVVKRFGSNRVHVVPMHAEWFSPTSVHRLERQVVPHFFSGKTNHTPEEYMECRNRIVAKCMENPDKRLSVTDCHGLVAGVDIDDISRIVRFLDHWGIINYCAISPHHETQNDRPCLNEDSNRELSLSGAAFKSIDSLIQFDKPKCRLKAADVYPDMACEGDEVSDLDTRIRERLTDNQCNYCSRPLPIVYYQSQKEVDVLLCLDCFNDGRHVTGHSSLDFVRIDPTKDYGDLDGESWTDQETLLLLEAIELYNENWNDIAEHVSTKTKAQCILHFIRLTIDDSPLENIDVPNTSISTILSNNDSGRSHSNANGNSTGASLKDPDSESLLPFANSGNPVMALVAFMASAIGPRIAAACAHASLAALSEGIPASENVGQMNGSGNGNMMNSESMHGREGITRGEIANGNWRNGENLGQCPQNQGDAEVVQLSAEKVRAAAKAGLVAAATKAKLFADHEEREIQRLSANIINYQFKRLELKLKQFAEVETMLMKECEQVERVRQRIAAERALMLSTHFGPAGVTRPMGPPGAAGPSMVNDITGNNRQEGISGSPSQPLVSRNQWGQYGMQQKMQLGPTTR